MKTATDNNGIKVQVSDDMVVKTVAKEIDGRVVVAHYLLTDADKAEIAQREADYMAEINQR